MQIRVHAIGINRAEIMYRNGSMLLSRNFRHVLVMKRLALWGRRWECWWVYHWRFGQRYPSFMFNEYGMYGEVVNAPVHASWSILKTFLLRKPLQAGWCIHRLWCAGWIWQSSGWSECCVRAASSSVGLAAIQIANMLGQTQLHSLGPLKKVKCYWKLDSCRHCYCRAGYGCWNQSNNNGVGAHIVFDPVGGPDVAKLRRWWHHRACFSSMARSIAVTACACI